MTLSGAKRQLSFASSTSVGAGGTKDPGNDRHASGERNESSRANRQASGGGSESSPTNHENIYRKHFIGTEHFKFYVSGQHHGSCLVFIRAGETQWTILITDMHGNHFNEIPFEEQPETAGFQKILRHAKSKIFSVELRQIVSPGAMKIITAFYDEEFDSSRLLNVVHLLRNATIACMERDDAPLEKSLPVVIHRESSLRMAAEKSKKKVCVDCIIV